MPSSPSSAASSEDEDFIDKGNDENAGIRNGIDNQFDLNPIRADSALLTLEELNSPDNEIWIVTTPKTVNTLKMHDLALPLKSGSKLKIGDFRAETLVQNESSHIAFLLPDSKGNLKLSMRQTEGSIRIVEDIKVPELHPASSMVKASFQSPLVGNLPRRHPLYSRDPLHKTAASSVTISKKKQKTKSTKSSSILVK